ncbi:exodeoxyribonuclease III [soil metagenome]
MLKLISWNVAGRVKKLTAQVGALIEHEPHIIALQEVTAKTTLLWRDDLERRGYWVIASFDLAREHNVLKGGRKYGVLLASRWPMEALPPTDFEVPWTERILSAVIDSPWVKIECHNAHLPAGVSHGLIKIETFEGIYGRLRHEGTRPRILCGDFNSPQEESVDGATIPFGTNNERWAAAELSVITGLGEYDLKDVFRLLNGFEQRDVSWVSRNRGREYGRRFDHVFASQRLNATTCAYLHMLREPGLSDHAPIEARFEPG